MNISGQHALAKHLGEHGAQSAYCVFSEEQIFLSEARAAIRRVLCPDERRLQSLDEDFDPDEAVRDASVGNLFAQKTLREYFSVKALSATHAEVLCAVAAASAASGSAVVVATPPPRKAKWLHDLEAVFVVATLPSVPRGRFAGWVSARASKLGLNLDEDVAQLIASMTEGDPSAAAQELDKLAMIVGSEGKVDMACARASVFDCSRDDVFTLREAIAAGDAFRTLRALRNLRECGIAEPLVVWAITEEVRALLALAGSGRAWVPTREHLTNLRGIAKRADQSQLKSFLSETAKADWYAKGMKKGDPWQALERLAFALAILAKTNRLPGLPRLA